MSNQGKIKTYALISEISKICHQNPTLSQIAIEGINNIIQHSYKIKYHQNFISMQQPQQNLIRPNNGNPNFENITYEQFKDLILNSDSLNTENIALSQNSNDLLLKMCQENPIFLDYLKRFSNEDMSKDQISQI